MNFSSSGQRDISQVRAVNKWNIELNARREIPSLLETVYYFLFLYKHLPTRSRLNSLFKKRMGCQSFLVLNCASDMSVADWLSQHKWKIVVIFHVWWYGFFHWCKSLWSTPACMIEINILNSHLQDCNVSVDGTKCNLWACYW